MWWTLMRYASMVKTLRALARLYSWYQIPTSPHKLLLHAHQIAAKFQTGLAVPLPIRFDHSAPDAAVVVECGVPLGITSEEAGESCNKLYRSDREHHTRKDKRKHDVGPVQRTPRKKRSCDLHDTVPEGRSSSYPQ
eukprot:gnl/Spiro4/10901_TR5807_c0_g1_i1.p2 gnl/Spiro4/10901_TR5807_c0_g1~~gnl/Spiro4/10901_TR5807_c0_g1_i1.p2  ORF type:complete len:136 (+),score=8.44 gnl/Spiro4/10901_TR5807_c0_g1_i1:188-595(+)